MGNEELQNEDEFIITLSLDGSSYEEVEVKVNCPQKSIRYQVNCLVEVLELPNIDDDGNSIQYLLGKVLDNDNEMSILKIEDKDGKELGLLDYNVQPGDHLYLISVLIPGDGCSDMENDELQNKHELIVNLEVEGKDIGKKVLLNPFMSIRNITNQLIRWLKLPYCCGSCMNMWYLGIKNDGEDEISILEFEDEAGREQCLCDCNVKPFDTLQLTACPVAVGFLSELKISDLKLNTKDVIESEMNRFGYRYFCKLRGEMVYYNSYRNTFTKPFLCLDPYSFGNSGILSYDTKNGIYKSLNFYLEKPVQMNESGYLYNTIYLLCYGSPDLNNLNCTQMRDFRIIISKYKVKLLNNLERMIRKIK